MKMPVLYSFLSSMSGDWGRVNGTAEDQGWGECGTAEPLNVAWWRPCFFFPSIMENLFPFMSLSMSPSSVKIPCRICFVVYSTASLKVWKESFQLRYFCPVWTERCTDSGTDSFLTCSTSQRLCSHCALWLSSHNMIGRCTGGKESPSTELFWLGCQ